MKTKNTCTLLFALLFLHCTIARAQAVDVQDSLALVDIYNSTNGDNWTSGSWLNGPVSTWTGVTVTNNRVTGISLGSNNMSGTLPNSIGNLTALTNLTLIFGQISGSIPASIGNLVNLEKLHLGSNNLTGSIPASIGNLTKLTYIILYYNQLSGSLPPEMGNLTLLNTLYLDHNELSGTLPATFANLINLHTFAVADNNLSGTIPAWFSAMPLYTLNLSLNQFSGNIPPALGTITSLGELYLQNNQLAGSIPPELAGCKDLSYLNLSSNRLTGKIPYAMCSLKNMHGLNLALNKLIGTIPDRLAGPQQKQMVSLDLYNNRLSGPVPAALSAHLFGSLRLSRNRFTFDGLEHITDLTRFVNYEKQARIPLSNNNGTLSVTAGGTLANNTYKWYHIGSPAPTVITGDSTFRPAIPGNYFVKVTNALATQLTLISDTLYIEASSLVHTTDAAAAQSIDHDIRLRMYPNPAQHTLYIQAAGNTSITLVNNAGVQVCTRAVSGSAAINVSKLPAGIYFVKDNATGAAKQIIIAH